MSLRRKLKGKKPPEGWDLIEKAIEDFELKLKDAVNEEHEGKRKTELNWKIHRLHWEKNRYIYDLMFVRKAMSKELYEWLVREKVADGALIAKWRKPGYEILCSMLAIQRGNHNFGTTSHCRVPLRARAAQQRITPDVQTGCISCASGDGKFGGPVWWNTPIDEPKEEDRDGQEGPSKKRSAEEAEIDDDEDIPDEVRARLEALKRR
uniref:G10 protein n=1 Tax=Polytomella parva TaxID=51329 RepID=A0A7S0V5F3_9CHLO|mmetsp:Transcript_28310/g.52132  ORF Transcript_28310/g.52132 Transcript_28310/m.52132 type:complete len:207 (+) Transcript_28310:49-669(+)